MNRTGGRPAAGRADSTPRPPWWRNPRGEWFVLVQIALMALVFFGPRQPVGRPGWLFTLPRAGEVLGVLFMACGGAFLLAAILRMGRQLTPLPYPKQGAGLVRSGPYSLVRHPMYGGGLLLALGWGLHARSWLTLAYVAILFAFLDVKTRLEERWLEERFPEYRDYRKRVRKLIPFVY